MYLERNIRVCKPYRGAEAHGKGRCRFKKLKFIGANGIIIEYLYV